METLLKGITDGLNYFTSGNSKVLTSKVTKENALEYYSPVNPGLSDTGYYLDLSEPPIGNRPVYNTYSNYKPLRQTTNYPSSSFNCKQPNWSANCQ